MNPEYPYETIEELIARVCWPWRTVRYRCAITLGFPIFEADE